MRKIFLLLLVAVFMPRNTFAYDFEVNGIYYDVISLTDFTCKVVGGEENSGNIVIPETVYYSNRTLRVVEIGNYAFSRCFDMTGITIPNSIKRIGEKAFEYCGLSNDVTIPNSVTEIAGGAFSGCRNVKNIFIPNTITKIEDGVFGECNALESIIIPNSVTEIGRSAFSSCTSLTSVNIPNSVEKIGEGAFDGCKNITSLIIPNSIKEINYATFANCSSLTNVVIPNSVTEIGYRAFYGCSVLTNVTLSSSIKEISNEAFGGCDVLTSLYTLNTTPPSINYECFTNNQYMTVNVFVPKGTLETYQGAENWNLFWHVQEYTDDSPEIKQEKCATPTIQYANGKLTFTCATKDAVCQSAITDTDVRLYSGNEIQLGVTYNISVYATKAGYAQSDVATATLCWIDAEPKTDGIGNGVAEVKALPVLIQSANGQISISGLDDGTLVCVYGANGVLTGSAVSNGGQVCVGTNMAPGSIAIVKIGERSVKALVK